MRGVRHVLLFSLVCFGHPAVGSTPLFQNERIWHCAVLARYADADLSFPTRHSLYNQLFQQGFIELREEARRIGLTSKIESDPMAPPDGTLRVELTGGPSLDFALGYLWHGINAYYSRRFAFDVAAGSISEQGAGLAERATQEFRDLKCYQFTE